MKKNIHNTKNYNFKLKSKLNLLIHSSDLLKVKVLHQFNGRFCSCLKAF